MKGGLRSRLRDWVPAGRRQQIREIFRRVSWPLYLGDRHYCLFCKRTFRIFKDFYGTANVRCPRCNSIGRYRLYYLFLECSGYLEGRRLRLLHFAPEATIASMLRGRENIEYVTADRLVSLVEGLCEAPDYEMDVCDIEFPDNTFDMVVCNHVLEHVRDDMRAMREIYRVLKSEGVALLQVPIQEGVETTFEDPGGLSDVERRELLGSLDHVRAYGQDYPSRLERVGFEVDTYDFAASLPKAEIERQRLYPVEKMYVATKPRCPEEEE